MTKQQSLKQRIRARMKKTGERYTSARAMILASRPPAPDAKLHAGVLEGYGPLGGIQSDTAILGRCLDYAGIQHPETGRAYSEAMLHGLCGGIGFLYAVFEYKGVPPMLTMVLRSRSMPETYLAGVFDRVGAQRKISETTSDAVAAKALGAALDAKKPAICVVDSALLPYSALPPKMAGMSPHHVAVVGRDGDRIWVDDRALTPISLETAALAEARAAYRKAKRRLFTIEPAQEIDWRASLVAALKDTVATMRDGDPTVPASFRSNCGFAGLRKWQTLLTDPKSKKGWPRVFEGGASAFAGLRRAYDCITHDYTAPRGGRPFYADFLDEAASLLGSDGLVAAASTFRASGEAWHRLAEQIAATDDESVREACKLADARAEAIDDGNIELASRLSAERSALGDACALEPSAASILYAELAETLGDIVALEQRGIDEIADAL